MEKLLSRFLFSLSLGLVTCLFSQSSSVFSAEKKEETKKEETKKEETKKKEESGDKKDDYTTIKTPDIDAQQNAVFQNFCENQALVHKERIAQELCDGVGEQFMGCNRGGREVNGVEYLNSYLRIPTEEYKKLCTAEIEKVVKEAVKAAEDKKEFTPQDYYVDQTVTKLEFANVLKEYLSYNEKRTKFQKVKVLEMDQANVMKEGDEIKKKGEKAKNALATAEGSIETDPTVIPFQTLVKLSADKLISTGEAGKAFMTALDASKIKEGSGSLAPLANINWKSKYPSFSDIKKISEDLSNLTKLLVEIKNSANAPVAAKDKDSTLSTAVDTLNKEVQNCSQNVNTANTMKTLKLSPLKDAVDTNEKEDKANKQKLTDINQNIAMIKGIPFQEQPPVQQQPKQIPLELGVSPQMLKK